MDQTLMRRAAFAFWAAASAGATCARGATAAPFAPTLAADAQVRTLAGNGIAGNLDGPRTQAEFVFPTAVAVCPTKAAATTSTNAGAIGLKLSGEALFNPYEGNGEDAPAMSDNVSYTFNDSSGSS